jgi:hypothetical protein
VEARQAESLERTDDPEVEEVPTEEPEGAGPRESTR